MKLLPILCASLLLVISLPPQESPELKEASDLTESLVKLFNEQKYDEALTLAKRALEIRERLLPGNDPRIGNSLVYLGDLYIAKRDYGKARETYQRLLQHQEQRFGTEDVKLAHTLERLGLLHYRAEDHSKAEDAYKRAVALKEKEYGTHHVEVAHSKFALAEFYRARRDFTNASPAYRRALVIYAKHSGVDSADFERTSKAYGCLGYEVNKPQVYSEINAIWPRPNAAQTASGIVLNGKALSLPKPDYPEAARERRLSGWVVVEVTIDETGTVVRAQDLCGGRLPYLSETSVQAAYKARFSPTKISGKPVLVTGVIQYNFVAR